MRAESRELTTAVVALFRDGGGRAHVSCHAMHGGSHIWPYAHRRSHPYNAGTEHVGFSPTRQTLLAPSAKRREVEGGEREG